MSRPESFFCLNKRRTALLCTLSLAAAAVHAEPAPPLDRLSISAGAFYAKPEIDINADTKYGRIDTPTEKTSARALARARADLMIGDRHGLSADYLRYDKSYNPRLAGSSVIDGVPVSGTASFDGKLKLDLAQLSYKWWFGEGNDVFGVGLGAAHYKAKISGTATAQVLGTIGGVSQTRNLTGSDSTSESATAPVLELGWRHAFSPELRMYADASGVKRNGGKINGHIYRGAVGVEWFALKNVGLVLDYGVHKIDLRRDSDRNADLRIRLAGPSAYVKVRF